MSVARQLIDNIDMGDVNRGTRTVRWISRKFPDDSKDYPAFLKQVERRYGKEVSNALDELLAIQDNWSHTNMLERTFATQRISDEIARNLSNDAYQVIMSKEFENWVAVTVSLYEADMTGTLPDIEDLRLGVGWDVYLQPILGPLRFIPGQLEASKIVSFVLSKNPEDKVVMVRASKQSLNSWLVLANPEEYDELKRMSIEAVGKDFRRLLK